MLKYQIDGLPRTQLVDIFTESTVILVEGRLFHLSSDVPVGADFARFVGKNYAIVPGDDLSEIEDLYARQNATELFQWRQRFISQVLADLPANAPVVPEPPEVQRDPVLKFIVSSLIPYILEKKDTFVNGVEKKLADRLHIKLQNGDKERNEKNNVDLPSASEVIGSLANKLNEDFLTLREFLDEGCSAYAKALSSRFLLISNGMCFNLVSSTIDQKGDFVRFSNNTYATNLARGVSVMDLERKVQDNIYLKQAALAIKQDKEIGARLLRAKLKKDGIYKSVFKNPLAEADGQSYDIPGTDFGVHVRDKSDTGAKYYIYIKIPPCAVPATNVTMRIPNLFYKMNPMHAAIPLKFDSGDIVLKELCVMEPKSNHQALDLKERQYDGLCIWEFRHSPIGEGPALNAYGGKNMSTEARIINILHDRVEPAMVMSVGPGHARPRTFYRSQEITLEEARAQGLEVAI